MFGDVTAVLPGILKRVRARVACGSQTLFRGVAVQELRGSWFGVRG